MQEVILFIMCYVVVFIFYEIFIVNKAKKFKNNKLSKNKMKTYKEPVEILYLKKLYKLDMDKISYNQLLQIIALTSSLDISIVVSVMSIINNFGIKILIGFILIFVLIFISYYLVYLFYKKKGMIKNG